jgi:hypothetical protein
MALNELASAFRFVPPAGAAAMYALWMSPR